MGYVRVVFKHSRHEILNNNKMRLWNKYETICPSRNIEKIMIDTCAKIHIKYKKESKSRSNVILLDYIFFNKLCMNYTLSS